MDYSTIRQYARQNRKNPTEAEAYFWGMARKRKLFNLRFNRQYVFPYRLDSDYTHYFIADFYCHEVKLIIEIDGRIHDYQKEYDKYREEILNALGLKVCRFTNFQILKEWRYVQSEIKSYLDHCKS